MRIDAALAGEIYGSEMKYDEVIAAMFQPTNEGAVAAPTVNASPARQLRDAIEPIAMHSVWSRSTNERLAALGHDFMTGYVCSRSALLGSPSPGVVAATFAVFEPSMISGVYAAGRSICDPEELLRARDEVTIASLDATIDGIDVDAAATSLRRGVEAAGGAGRPLFSGLADLPWPESSTGQLWRASELFREHRGDSHVASCVAAGLDAAEMNLLTELFVGMPLASYSASRGWTEDALGAAADRLRSRGFIDGEALSSEGLIFRQDLEAQTDALQQPIIDAIGDDLGSLLDVAVRCSQRCLETKAFPPDVFKRAAG